jgi:hypothetical protein
MLSEGFSMCRKQNTISDYFPLCNHRSKGFRAFQALWIFQSLRQLRSRNWLRKGMNHTHRKWFERPGILPMMGLVTMLKLANSSDKSL